ncbi:MAG: hypothetical protein QOE51_1907 [Actinoplanes sp.]|jgi:hypothetical protein|nr:hypothetical protein [Actinoplanes sp.]
MVELVEESEGLAGLVLRVEAIGEVVSAEVVVGLVAGEHGPDSDQDGVPDPPSSPQLIRDFFGIGLSLVTIGNYLRSWGL